MAFQDVRINRTLCQEFDAFLLASFFFEDADEFNTDHLALGFRICHTGQLIQEAINSINVNQVSVHLIAEHFNHLFRFTLTEQTMVNVHANELLADGLDQQSSDDGRVDTTGQCQQHLLVADLFAHELDLFFNESRCKGFIGDALHRFGADNSGHWSSPQTINKTLISPNTATTPIPGSPFLTQIL